MNSQPTPLLILFDIDGTLLLSGRAGMRGMNLAFQRLHGRTRALEGVAIAGRTDRAITLDVFRSWGLDPSEDEITVLRDEYCRHLATEIQRPVSDPCLVLPGVTDLLDSLEETGEHTGLLTGNFEQGAAIKLGHFGIASRFAFGAYGDHHVNRRDLVPLALTSAREAGCLIPSLDCVIVIGDTPHDVDCAHAHGARAIAVATGGFSTDALRATGADLVVETLEDTARIRAWMTTG